MAAKSKSELIVVTDNEFIKLAKLLATIPADQAMQKDSDGTSIKDVIAHRAHWIDLFLGWYANGQAGNPVFFPAKGYKWNDLKRYNADLRALQANLSWEDAVKMLNSNAEKLCAFIAGHTNIQLYGGPMKGANNAWTTGRWAEAAGPSHYRSAAKYLRKQLREMPS